MRRATAILRHRLAPSAAACALALGLAACGQAETGPGGETASTEATEAERTGQAETGPLAGDEPRGDVGELTPIEERPGQAEEYVEDVDPSEADAPHVSSGPDDPTSQP